MGKAARDRHRRERKRWDDESVLRELGAVYFSGSYGEEVRLEGAEAEGLRDLMRRMCPICAAGENH